MIAQKLLVSTHLKCYWTYWFIKSLLLLLEKDNTENVFQKEFLLGLHFVSALQNNLDWNKISEIVQP